MLDAFSYNFYHNMDYANYLPIFYNMLCSEYIYNDSPSLLFSVKIGISTISDIKIWLFGNNVGIFATLLRLIGGVNFLKTSRTGNIHENP